MNRGGEEKKNNKREHLEKQKNRKTVGIPIITVIEKQESKSRTAVASSGQ